MKTILKTNITVNDICKGFVYNELEGKGLFGLAGKLTIQPEYQRNYIGIIPSSTKRLTFNKLRIIL